MDIFYIRFGSFSSLWGSTCGSGLSACVFSEALCCDVVRRRVVLAVKWDSCPYRKSTAEEKCSSSSSRDQHSITKKKRQGVEFIKVRPDRMAELVKTLYHGL